MYDCCVLDKRLEKVLKDKTQVRSSKIKLEMASPLRKLDCSSFLFTENKKDLLCCRILSYYNPVLYFLLHIILVFHNFRSQSSKSLRTDRVLIQIDLSVINTTLSF